MKAEMGVMLDVKDGARSVKFNESLGFDMRWARKGDDGRLDYESAGIGGAVIALGRILEWGAPGGAYGDDPG